MLGSGIITGETLNKVIELLFNECYLAIACA
jgi:hypothetical protein